MQDEEELDGEIMIIVKTINQVHNKVLAASLALSKS